MYAQRIAPIALLRRLRPRISPDDARYDNWWRTAIIAALDVASWPVAFLFATTIEEWSLTNTRVLLVLAWCIGGQLLWGLLLGLYRRRYIPFSFEEIGVAAVTVGLAGLSGIVVDLLVVGERFGHRTIWATATAAPLMLGVRYARRFRARYARGKRARQRTPVVVVGAGEGGQRAIRAMLSSAVSPYRPVALLDDDATKRGLRVMGVRVLGGFDDLAAVAHRVHADAAVLAIPSAGPDVLSRLHRAAVAAGLQTLVLPPVQQLVGTGSTAELRTYTDDDVLRRRVVTIDMEAVGRLIAGRTVLVTGAGGSIGSELALQVAQLGPQSLTVLDHDDSLLHGIERRLGALAPAFPIFPVLADIRDAERVHTVLDTYRPEVVFHAAALKHVPALEAAPTEGWKTNVLGTRNVLAAAEAAGVQRFVNISTDKAAEPVSVLGRTKRTAEQLTAAVAQRTERHYVSVRFGNVIGSRGSVMETFLAQIDAGGPVTVTHPEVTRYFMAVREAVRLTLQAATVGRPGEVLVLDMGAPVRIADVARQLIEQSGKQIQVTYTGLRPGEKLHEVLLSGDEQGERPFHPLVDHVIVPPLWFDGDEPEPVPSPESVEFEGFSADHDENLPRYSLSTTVDEEAPR